MYIDIHTGLFEFEVRRVFPTCGPVVKIWGSFLLVYTFMNIFQNKIPCFYRYHKQKVFDGFGGPVACFSLFFSSGVRGSHHAMVPEDSIRSFTGP